MIINIMPNPVPVIAAYVYVWWQDYGVGSHGSGWAPVSMER